MNNLASYRRPDPLFSLISYRVGILYHLLDGSMVLMHPRRGFTGMSYAAFRCVFSQMVPL